MTEKKKDTVSSNSSIKFSLVGDVMGARNVRCTRDQYLEKFSRLEPLFFDSDISICNLETVISDRDDLQASPLSRSNFKSSVIFLEHLSKIFNVYLLANNHIGDFGSVGVSDTLANIEKLGLYSAGIISKRNGISYIEVRGTQVCVLSYTTLNIPNIGDYKIKRFSKASFLKDMRACKKISNIVIVSLHGGRENVEFVDPELRKISKFAIDEGASFVYGHHPHVLSGYEIYKNRPIFYSLGNFIFDNPINKNRRMSCILSLDINLSGDVVNYAIRPLTIGDDFFPVVDDSTREATCHHIFELSSFLSDKSNDKRFWDKSSSYFIDNSKDNLKDVFKKIGMRGLFTYLKRVRFKHIILLTKSVFRKQKDDTNIYTTEKLSLLRKIKRRLLYIVNQAIFSVSPILLTKIRYLFRFGKILNLQNPKNFNEKIQYLKHYYYTDFETKCADKLKVREYVSESIGANYLNTIYAVYDNPNQINYNELPGKFVIKCNHGSGYNIIVLDKEKLNIPKVNKILKIWLKENYAYRSAETQYKNIQRKIFIEKYLSSDGTYLPKDYKVFCFHGEAKYIMIISDRETGYKRQFYDLEWNPLNLSTDFVVNHQNHIKPIFLDELIRLSNELSKNIPFVRIDFFEVNDGLVFSEMTFTPVGGMARYYHQSSQVEIGNYISISKAKKHN